MVTVEGGPVPWSKKEYSKKDIAFYNSSDALSQKLNLWKFTSSLEKVELFYETLPCVWKELLHWESV
jgi:hypothetical protein